MERFGINQRLLVKKSPVVIVKTFIVLQMTAVAVFFLSGVLLDYGEIYDRLPLSTSFSFHIVEAIAIFALETVIVFYIFFRWYKEYYDIQDGQLVHGRGIVYRRKTVLSLASVGAVSYRQGPLGKLTEYGNIELVDRSGDKFVLDHVPEPQRFVELLLRIKDSFQLSKSDEAIDINKLISAGEHDGLEFKTSFRWDVNQGKVNKNLERATMKTAVAFLNSNGGMLVIGVDDSGNVVGLENDYKSLPKANADGFQNHFSNVFHSSVGPEYRQYVKLSMVSVGDKECCLVEISPSVQPAYLKLDNAEEFFIRTGNGTTSLKLSEASSYISSHWKAKLL